MLKLTVFYFIGAYKPPGNVRQYDIFTEKLETYDFFELKKGNTESTKFKKQKYNGLQLLASTNHGNTKSYWI
ncbi:hypothetical protein BUQ74_18065 [Leptospira weilii serovar Heyan]|nr:hypothetical protein BUQ74_18065 [Leptospira weilii serovar Heyan]